MSPLAGGALTGLFLGALTFSGLLQTPATLTTCVTAGVVVGLLAGVLVWLVGRVDTLPPTEDR